MPAIVLTPWSAGETWTHTKANAHLTTIGSAINGQLGWDNLLASIKVEQIITLWAHANTARALGAYDLYAVDLDISELKLATTIYRITAKAQTTVTLNQRVQLYYKPPGGVWTAHAPSILLPAADGSDPNGVDLTPTLALVAGTLVSIRTTNVGALSDLPFRMDLHCKVGLTT